MLTRREKVLRFIDKYILLLPIMFAIAVIPLIVRVAFYDPQLSQYAWFSDSDKTGDMYMYYKNQAMMLLDAVLLLGYIYLVLRRKIITDLKFLPLFVYMIMMALSTMMSVSPEHTWNGFYGMMESAYTLFGYAMICYFAFTVIRTEKQLKWVLGIFAIGTVIMGLIAVSQFVGMDFFDTDFALDLVFPKELEEYKTAMVKRVGDGTVYTTLYNQNYVGVYTCLLVPIVFVFLLSAKSKIQAIAGVVLMVFSLVCLVGSNSQAAVLSLIAGVLVLIICFSKKHFKSLIATLIVSGAIFIGLNMYQGENNTLSDTIDVVVQDGDWNVEENLTDITLNDDNLYL